MNFFTRQGRTLLLAAILFIAAQTALAQQQQNYTGNGGKGISLTIYVPQSTGLAKNQNYIPALVQGEFVSTFSNYSAISILDWERLDDIYVKLVNEAYDDNAAAKQDVILGRLAPTSHFLTGNITKTATGYNIKMNITATADKLTAATYSGTFSFAELDNLTGIRRASLELLQKVGVELTEKARQELVGTVDANQISAQTALAKGVTAQRAGTEVVALSYYFQAASFNPALKEAVKRSTVAAANISSGNIGADMRNDIEWRKKWVAKLKETEEIYYEMINAIDPPYTLYYSTDIKTGKINYQTETADLSITTNLSANRTRLTAMEQTLGAAQAVFDGLNTTNRKRDWGLEGWPRKGVSNTNPFSYENKKQYDITIVFELVNQQGRVIGSQTVKFKPTFYISIDPYFGINQMSISFIGDYFGEIIFKGVKASDISDNLTIRVATVNGVASKNARFTIAAISNEKSQPLIDNRDGKRYKTVKIGIKTWMAENLNYQTDSSWCYGNADSNCVKYGRLYTWNVAKNACPSGWHLSNKQEWDHLISLTDGSEKKLYIGSGTNLKAKSGWSDFRGQSDNGADLYGFSALPSGSRNNSGGFKDAGRGGYWWTTEVNEFKHSQFIYIVESVRSGHGENANGFSIRCVQD